MDEDCDALLAEAYLVTQFDHKNVVACFGQVCCGILGSCCLLHNYSLTRSTLQVTKGDPAMIIFEFMANGSLFTFLKDVRICVHVPVLKMDDGTRSMKSVVS